MNETSPQVYAAPPQQGRQLAPLAAQTTPENPWPLRLLAEKMRTYIDKMSPLWIEAQVVEYKPRPGTRMSFFVVRDVESDTSINVTAFAGVVEAAGRSFDAGAKVIMHVKPNFWETRGSLSLRAAQILIEGEGDLLARVEELRRKLAAEGLFAADRKRPLPFLPRRVGLICGRNAKAKEDVIVNAQARWPIVQFEIREVAVQGEHCASEVSAAIRELDSLPGVDVIVVTRGGGAVEDLLPFSDESLVRAAFACTTPLVSAIGHEEDAPLLDLVADYRASTPTDAARRIVPDARELGAELDHLSARLTAAINRRLSAERENLQLLASRPVLARPGATIEQQSATLENAVLRLRTSAGARLTAEQTTLVRMESTLRALSPHSTLQRGYAILRSPSGQIVRRAQDIKRGDLLEGVLAEGSFVAQVFGTNPAGGISPAAESHPHAEQPTEGTE